MAIGQLVKNSWNDDKLAIMASMETYVPSPSNKPNIIQSMANYTEQINNAMQYTNNADGTVTTSDGRTGIIDTVTGVFTDLAQIKADAKVKTYTRWAIIGVGSLIALVILLIIFKNKK
jgi:hypothetical protein